MSSPSSEKLTVANTAAVSSLAFEMLAVARAKALNRFSPGADRCKRQCSEQLLLREVRRFKCQGIGQLLAQEARRYKHRGREQLSMREARSGKGQGMKSLLSRSSPLQTPMQ